MSQYHYTKHATARMQQRGFGHQQVARLVDLADLYTPIGRAMGALRVSRSALAEAVAEGTLPQADADRLSRRAVVMAEDGAIVTLAHLCGRKSASYKRRDRRAHWR